MSWLLQAVRERAGHVQWFTFAVGAAVGALIATLGRMKFGPPDWQAWAAVVGISGVLAALFMHWHRLDHEEKLRARKRSVRRKILATALKARLYDLGTKSAQAAKSAASDQEIGSIRILRGEIILGFGKVVDRYFDDLTAVSTQLATSLIELAEACEAFDRSVAAHLLSVQGDKGSDLSQATLDLSCDAAKNWYQKSLTKIANQTLDVYERVHALLSKDPIPDKERNVMNPTFLGAH